MFLAHFTGSGINEIMDYYVDFYDECLKSAVELYEIERDSPIRAVVLGFAKEGNE